MNPPCPATTKSGKPCKMRCLDDGDTCMSHSERGQEQRRLATQASAEARRLRREAREEASEAAALTLTQRIRAEVAADADGFAKALVAHAKAHPQSAAMTEVLNRTEGKVTETVKLEGDINPFEMNEDELHRWLREAPAEDSTITQDDSFPS